MFLLLTLFIPARPVAAQGESPLTATVDRTSLSAGETLVLTITVAGSMFNPPQPELPPLDNFNIIGRSTSSQISMINGAVSAQTAYLYTLQPTREGELTIGPVSLTIDGQTYTTAPITVQVTPGSAPPPGGAGQPSMQPVEPAPAPGELTGQEEFYVEAEVDNPAPYVGQQVKHTFRFYQAVNLFDQPRYEAPDFNGFWSEAQPDQGQYTVQVAGRPYRVTELYTLLFPTAPGPVTIGSARLTLPGDFFRRGADLQTNTLDLDVKPLPPGAPAGFNGAVGQFTLTAATDVSQGKVNEPITLRVTLAGTGNLNAVPDPDWPDVDGWRSFDSQATTNTEVKDGKLTGSRVYERIFVPAAPGDFTLPPLTYVYFDPETAAYQTLTTDPIPVSIAPVAAEAPTPAPLPAASSGDTHKETVEYLATDIRHIKPVPPALNRAALPLTARPVYWLAWLVPLLAIVGHFVWQQRQIRQQSKAALMRSSRARKQAQKAINRARKQKQDPYVVAGQILTGYLADKFNRPVAGLTHRALGDLLAGRGVSPALIERVNTCLAAAELGRFAPEAANPAHAQRLLDDVAALIKDLDKTRGMS